MELEETLKHNDQGTVLHLYEENGKFGYVDENNHIVIPCKWADAGEFSEGLAPVMNEEGWWGYINTEGQIKIPYRFKDANLFIDGWTFVVCDDRLTDGTPIEGIRTVIDYEGEVIGTDCCLLLSQLEIMAKAHILAKENKYQEAINLILPVAANCSLDYTPIAKLMDYYIELEQYEEAVKWCQKALRRIDFDEGHSSFFLNQMGVFYRDGHGVNQDALEAFQYFHESVMFCQDEIAQLLIDDLFRKYPDLKDLSEVQSALAPFDEGDDF